MEIREIEAFLALAEELHFGRTAQRMDVSASRVSQLLRALERRVGGQLVHRDGRGVSLTELGEQLLAEARPGYARLEPAMVSPPLRLGTWIDYISRRGCAVIGPPWTLADFFWPGLAAVPIRGLAPIHAVLAARDDPEDPPVAAFLRVAEQARLPFGHGTYLPVADRDDPGTCG